MSADTQFHVHHDAPEVVGRRERLGVRLLIVADGAFVFGMIFTFVQASAAKAKEDLREKQWDELMQRTLIAEAALEARSSQKLGERN